MIGSAGLYARNDSGSVGACPRNLKFEIKKWSLFLFSNL